MILSFLKKWCSVESPIPPVPPPVPLGVISRKDQNGNNNNNNNNNAPDIEPQPDVVLMPDDGSFDPFVRIDSFQAEPRCHDTPLNLSLKCDNCTIGFPKVDLCVKFGRSFAGSPSDSIEFKVNKYEINILSRGGDITKKLKNKWCFRRLKSIVYKRYIH